MSIFKKIKQSITGDEQSVQERYIELLKRVDKPLEGDEDALKEIIKTLGVSVDRAENDAAVLAEVRNLQPIVDDFANRSHAMNEAREAAIQYGRETQLIVGQRQMEHGRLSAIHSKAESKVSHANQAVERVRLLVTANRKLFPIDPLAGYIEASK